MVCGGIIQPWGITIPAGGANDNVLGGGLLECLPDIS